MISVPNALSALRLILVAFVWIPAVAGLHVVVAIGIAIAGATDVADGIIARRTGSASRLGSQLDSVADLALMGSTLAWLAILRPQFFLENHVLLLLWLALGLVTLLVGWVRFRRIGDLHLYSAKAAGSLAYLFAIYLLLATTYDRRVFLVVLGVSTLATLEALIVFVVARAPERARYHTSVVTLLRRRMRSRRAGE